jgi:predicted Zn-dependent protease
MRPSPLAAVVALCFVPVACGPSLGSRGVARSPLAAQWFDRAKASYRAADFDDARDAVKHALAAAPSDGEVRELAARVALVRLDFQESLFAWSHHY